ncbi:hypothetical protein ACJZ2D_015073 [Fusarium nematophilum]
MVNIIHETGFPRIGNGMAVRVVRRPIRITDLPASPSAVPPPAAGHHVQVFEQSELLQETGAAIHIAPNANGLLRRLGLNVADIGATECASAAFFSPSGKKLTSMAIKPMSDKFWAYPWNLVHRLHLHTALKEMALGDHGKGEPAKLHLGSRLVSVDPVAGTVELEDGRVVHGDVIIGADGVHAKSRKSIPGGDLKPFGSGTWQEMGNKDRMLEIYKTWAPDVLAILEKVDASKLRVWKLLDMEPMPCYNFEKLAVVGDAAHPFLPHQGQGGAQAIEDAMALGALLSLGTTPDEVADRLRLYNECRYERAQAIQEDSRVVGMDKDEKEATGQREMDPWARNIYQFSHDAWDHATAAFRQHVQARDPNVRFRSPTVFGPAPGPRRPLGLPPSHPSLLALQSKTPESMTNWTIRCRSTRTYLEQFLAPGFSISSPGTNANVSFSIISFDNMAWLGGGGYNALAVLINGVEYKKTDGSKVYGSFMATLFEDCADPIVTGRDELAHPKIFCDIDIQHRSDGCFAKLSWRGTEFAVFDVAGLKPEPGLEGLQAAAPAEIDAGAHQQTPPTPPPEQGIFTYRYVPAVGEPGTADVEYPVLSPFPAPKPGQTPPDVLVTKNAYLKFEKPGWNSLPTLHHVAEALADIPILEVLEAKMTRTVGIVDNGMGVHRIE